MITLIKKNNKNFSFLNVFKEFTEDFENLSHGLRISTLHLV